MTDFTDSLRHEIARLEAALRADPTFLKLEELRRVLRLYAGESGSSSTPRVPAGQTATPTAAYVTRTEPKRRIRIRSQEKRSAHEVGGRSGEIARATLEILAARQGRPITTLELLDTLAARGLTFGGNAPQNALSSLMSKTREIQSGPGGWTLAPDANELADSDDPGEETLSANEPQSAPVEPGGEVAHEKIGLF